MSRPVYLVQRTDRTGHWRGHFVTTQRRRAVNVASGMASYNNRGRSRVMVRVTQGGIVLATWINGQPAQGAAFR